jgi:hypothetical protein
VTDEQAHQTDQDLIVGHPFQIGGWDDVCAHKDGKGWLCGFGRAEHADQGPVTLPRLSRATPPVLVRLQLEWEASHHNRADLEVTGNGLLDWRLLTVTQLDYLDCTDDRCIDVRSLLRRAWQAGRMAGIGAAQLAVEAMVGPHG